MPTRQRANPAYRRSWLSGSSRLPVSVRSKTATGAGAVPPTAANQSRPRLAGLPSSGRVDILHRTVDATNRNLMVSHCEAYEASAAFAGGDLAQARHCREETSTSCGTSSRGCSTTGSGWRV